uniref:Allergen Fel d 4-like n=1 Tax=Castor canadensis TaxID=51338 RepID=A0A8B7TX42_CASCN|nr:allergen Fel d 4-like [Castor canadensis]
MEGNFCGQRGLARIRKKNPELQTIQLLLLCLGLTLVWANKGKNFDLSKIKGKWYPILLACDQRKKIEENGSMRVFVEYIDVLANSSLQFTLHTFLYGECTDIFLVCEKTDKDGIYAVQSNTQDSVVTVTPSTGREPDVSSEIKEKVVKFCEEHGIVKENILDLTKVDRCLQARDGQEA